MLVIASCMYGFKVISGVSGQSTVHGKRRVAFRSYDTRRYVYGYDENGHFKTRKVGLVRGWVLNRFKIVSSLVVCKVCQRQFKIQARKSNVKAFICERCRTGKDE